MSHHSHLLRALVTGALPIGLSSIALAGDLKLTEVETGFGQLLPHAIYALDVQGLPTSQVVQIRSLDDLLDHATPSNGVHPTSGLPQAAVLPNGQAGNQFISVRFDQDLDIASVLSNDPAQSGPLAGSIEITAIDPSTGAEHQIAGRSFVGGRTFAAPAGSAALQLQTWVKASSGSLVASGSVDNDGDGTPDGLGFPGTESGFQGDLELAGGNVYVFVRDTDGDLSTHETFPAGVEIVVKVGDAVRSRAGDALVNEGRTSTRVGADTLAPRVRMMGGSAIGAPAVLPRNGAQGVDPTTTVTIGFTEPVRISSFGELTGSPFSWDLDSSVELTAGTGTQSFSIPASAAPASVWDMSTIVVTPKFPFPGTGASGAGSTGLNQIGVQLHAGRVADLESNLDPTSTSTAFTTGVGQGVINAPVAPDAIYAGVSGQLSALSVIDLNGFGQGTGNPTWDAQNPTIEGNSNYPNNPNVSLQGSSMQPPLSVGSSTVDGGSAGVFTKTLDSNLDSRLAQSPVLLNVSDMALGGSLDLVFNNAPAPFGCQSGGGNLCATSGMMQTNVSVSGTTGFSEPYDGTHPLANSGVAAGNTVSWAPHPNPPPIVFPPLCVSPFIGSQEPTSVVTGTLGLTNLLVPGDPFGNPGIGVPPSGLLATQQNTFFQGPSGPQAQIGACQPFMVRQQVGQFLYVVDRQRKELVVLNSNRMVAIERIPLPDPARLAMSPNLDLLAVTNRRQGTVSFIDIEPSSATFHTVVQTTAVGRGPLGIAWDSMNEDILVCNERSNDISVLSAFSLQVRKVVSLPGMKRPFEVVITPRQTNFGFQRNVYFGYVASRDGRISIFESGPGGANGWGFDDMIGSVQYRFHNPKALAVSIPTMGSGVWVAHEGAIDPFTKIAAPPGTGAVSLLSLSSAIVGAIGIQPGEQPSFRDMQFSVAHSFGEDDNAGLTGIPVDLAFDNQLNLGALPGVGTPFSAGSPVAFNSKALVRDQGVVRPVSKPLNMFASVPNSSQGGGVVDVLQFGATPPSRLDTNPFQAGVQSVPMPGVGVLADYFRQ